MMKKSSKALISVWHSSGSLLNGPTLSSLLGIVSSNALPSCDVNVKEISAGIESISEQGIPYVPGSPLKGLIFDEIWA